MQRFPPACLWLACYGLANELVAEAWGQTFLGTAAKWALSVMGIKFNCPNGHKLNVKSFLAGRRGICPECDARFRIPMESGGVAELVHKGERGGEDTQLTAAMQDDYYSAGEAFGGGAARYQEPAFGSPLGPMVGAADWPASHVAATPAAAIPTTGNPLAGVDLLTEDPQAVWYVRPRSGGQYGPAVGEILSGWIREGRVAGDSLVWREGWADWRAASSVFPQLASLLSVPSAAVPPAPSFAQATAGIAAASKPVKGSLLDGGILPAGGVLAGAISGVGVAPTAGVVPINPLGGEPKKKVEIRRQSGNFTAVMVIVLVVVAVVLIAVFTWVMTRQPQAPAPTAHLREAIHLPIA